MTFFGWLTIFAFAAILTAIALPLARYMVAVYSGEHTFLDPVLRGPERWLYRVMRVDPSSGQDWKAYAKSLIIFSLAGWLLLYLILRTQTLVGLHRVESAALSLGHVECDVQHGLIVFDQHQLAVLQRRDNDELLQSDGRADGSEFPLGWGWHRDCGGADSGDHRTQREKSRQLLAGHGAHDPLAAASPLGVGRARAGLPGSDPELLGLFERVRIDPPGSDDRDGPGRLTGGDQDARHERRRVLQHQLRASVREPERLHELLRDVGCVGDSRPRSSSPTAG